MKTIKKFLSVLFTTCILLAVITKVEVYAETGISTYADCSENIECRD